MVRDNDGVLLIHIHITYDVEYNKKKKWEFYSTNSSGLFSLYFITPPSETIGTVVENTSTYHCRYIFIAILFWKPYAALSAVAFETVSRTTNIVFFKNYRFKPLHVSTWRHAYTALWSRRPTWTLRVQFVNTNGDENRMTTRAAGRCRRRVRTSNVISGELYPFIISVRRWHWCRTRVYIDTAHHVRLFAAAVCARHLNRESRVVSGYK